MADKVYNEDVYYFALTVYEEAALACREMRALLEGNRVGMYSDNHIENMRNKVKNALDVELSDLENCPDLDEWDGDNTPQRIYKAEGGHGAVLAIVATSTAISVAITNGGSGYVRAPNIEITSDTGSGATFSVTIDDDGKITAVTATAVGSGYPTIVSNKVTPAPPTLTTATDAEKADENHIPSGWEGSEPETNSTTNRNVYRAERTGPVGDRTDWETPTLHAEYSA